MMVPLCGRSGPLQATCTGISNVGRTVTSHRALTLVSRGTKSQELSTEEAVKPGLSAHACVLGRLNISAEGVCL